MSMCCFRRCDRRAQRTRQHASRQAGRAPAPPHRVLRLQVQAPLAPAHGDRQPLVRDRPLGVLHFRPALRRQARVTGASRVAGAAVARVRAVPRRARLAQQPARTCTSCARPKEPTTTSATKGRPARSSGLRRGRAAALIRRAGGRASGCGAQAHRVCVPSRRRARIPRRAASARRHKREARQGGRSSLALASARAASEVMRLWPGVRLTAAGHNGLRQSWERACGWAAAKPGLRPAATSAPR